MENITVVDGLVVSLNYSLTVEGQVIDASGETPLQYLQGYNNIIAGLERELAGMAVGDEKEVQVAPEDAYGEYNPDGIFDLPREQFPENFSLQVGHPLRVRSESGQVMTARISAVNQETVQIDTNHPLAGKELFFRAKIVGLRPATTEELANGRLGGSCSACDSQGNCTGEC
jgi:FKBP-type peptidyl-prolyl cis-trans isomerase SlyD